jgi:chromosome partitioning protein
MAVLSFHSAKGGVGKTTLTINVAVEFAFQGIRTAVLDADLNQHSTRFGEVFCAVHPELPLTFTGRVSARNFTAELKAAESSADIVIVDLPAGTGGMSFRAVMRSHLVIIPAQRTVLDLRDAARTAAHIADAEDYSNEAIYSALVWSRETNRFESRTERLVREGFLSMLADPARAFLDAPLMESDAYRAGLVHAWVPREFAARSGTVAARKVPGRQPESFFIPKGTANAAENIAAVAGGILERLKAIASGANPGKVILRPEHLAQMRESVAAFDTEVA